MPRRAPSLFVYIAANKRRCTERRSLALTLVLCSLLSFHPTKQPLSTLRETIESPLIQNAAWTWWYQQTKTGIRVSAIQQQQNYRKLTKAWESVRGQHWVINGEQVWDARHQQLTKRQLRRSAFHRWCGASAEQASLLLLEQGALAHWMQQSLVGAWWMLRTVQQGYTKLMRVRTSMSRMALRRALWTLLDQIRTAKGLNPIMQRMYSATQQGIMVRLAAAWQVRGISTVHSMVPAY